MYYFQGWGDEIAVPQRQAFDRDLSTSAAYNLKLGPITCPAPDPPGSAALRMRMEATIRKAFRRAIGRRATIIADFNVLDPDVYAYVPATHRTYDITLRNDLDPTGQKLLDWGYQADPWLDPDGSFKKVILKYPLTR